MAVKGKAREDKGDFVKDLYIGFTTARVVAINPTRAELARIMGTEAAEDKEEFSYVKEDDNGNINLRLTFWLHSERDNVYFPQTIYLTNTKRVSKDESKVQIMNSTAQSFWAPVDGDGEVDESLILDWFLQFKKKGEVIGEKTWRVAMKGEDELGVLLRSWLRFDWMDPDTEVMFDMEALFRENYKELRGYLNSDYDVPFTILTGVRTNEEDPSKKYQEVCKKAYLPFGYMQYIENGLKFPSDYARNTWSYFLKDIQGEYGFNASYKLAPLSKYDVSQDPVGTNAGKPATAPADNEY